MPERREWAISHDPGLDSEVGHMAIQGPPTHGMVSVVEVPWMPGTEAEDRVPPRECIRAARDALDRAYSHSTAPWPLIAEAVDWQRRALEQMVPPAALSATKGHGS